MNQRELAPGARVFDVLIGRQLQPANAAVTRLAASPACPVVGERTAVSVEVANWSAAAVERGVVLEMGESRQERRGLLAPGARATVDFEIVPARAGNLDLSAVIGEDGLPADNRRFLALRVTPAIQAGLVDLGAADGRYLRAALEAPPSFIAVRGLPAEAWTGRSALAAEVLFLCGWNGAEAGRVAELLAAGKTVVWTLPEGGAVRLDLPGQPGFRAELGPLVARMEASPGRLRPARADDPLLAIFRGGTSGDLSSVAFRRYRQLTLSGAQTVLAYDDGVPALARVAPASGGTLFLWNLPLAPAASDLAGSNFLLPLVRELVRQNRGSAPSPAALAGASAAVEVPLSADPAGLKIEAPGGAELPFRVVPGVAAARLELDRVAVPGICRVRDRGREIEMLAVNVPEPESDLRQMSGGELERGGALAVEAEQSVLGLREGTPLWPALLALALAALAAENALLAFWKREG